MNCKVQKSKIAGTISCPTNKSYSHRVIFLATLSEGKSILHNVLDSADVKSTIHACKGFGADISIIDESVTINSKGVINATKIDAANSGTTIRIAAAIASLSDGTTTLTGDSSLKKRPMQPLLDALESMGAKCTSTDGKPPISVRGKISGGEVSIAGNISSQFISALMISGPLTKDGIELKIEGELVSKPYLEATIAIMKKFGVKVHTLIPYKKYQITPQIYHPTEITVPSDFSSLALLLSSAVLVGKDVKIKVAMGDLPQGDEAFIDILEALGVRVIIDEETISINNVEKLSGGKFDLSNTPDLLPPLSILALKSQKPIEIVNVGHARFKETDRIAIIARELKKIGIKIIEKSDGMILESSDQLHGATLNAENDHRLFMAFCIVGMHVGNCTITDPESIDISYPGFIKEMKNCGADIIIE